MATGLASAGTGDAGVSPRPGIKPKSKLTMTVDTSWVDGPGYRPVRVVLSTMPPAPCVDERTFEIELKGSHYSYGTNDEQIVRGYLTIPQGSAAAETTISVPGGIQSALQVEVKENRRVLSDMSLGVNLHGNNGVQNVDGFPTFLIIDSKAPTRADRLQIRQARLFNVPGAQIASTHNLPDMSTLAALNRYVNYSFGGSNLDDAALLQALASTPHIELLPPIEVPEKWLDLTSFDVVITTLGELRGMQTNQPQRFAALRDWTAAGGSLCVFGAGEELEHLTLLEETLRLPPADPADKGYPARGWVAPNMTSYNPNFQLGEDPNGPNYGGPGRPRRGNRIAVNTMQVGPQVLFDEFGQPVPGPQAAAPSTLPQLRLRDLQMGRVVAVSVEKPFPGSVEQWNWICQNIGKSNLSWQQRNGLSITADNTDYWDFLIPGVGMAPVTGFRVLISLFVILIGPVNYVLLRRWRRLYLLLVTVPTGATVVTLCLLAYALTTDGLGVRARVRSYTHIDQRTGSAVSWSRQSFYAGVAPSRGLSFPEDTAVFGIVDRRFDTGSKHRNLLWKDKRQNLQSGYINSRITAQYLAIRAHHKTPSRVEISESADGSGPLSIENRLGTRIHQIAICDSQGEWYLAEGLDAGENASPAKIAATDAMHALRQLMAENPPAEPAGFSPNSSRNYGYGGWRRNRYYYMNYNNQSLPPTMRTSLLELGLRMSVPGGGAPLAPRSYVAVVEKSPEVPFGVETARQEASLHVVVGEW